ncbi:hypothetical protein PQR75_01100 [Paraburkholderia fungorum]|uniref:hypothetical protein n=1 Tax=Paraburkholderia fungorum TaxID=134537 RepID=UPI0038B7D951
MEKNNESNEGFRRAFESACETFFRRAVGTYTVCTGKTEKDFRECVYEPLAKDSRMGPYTLSAAFPKDERPDWHHYLRLACGFEITARIVFGKGHASRAWPMLCDAYYHLGKTQSSAMVTVGAKRAMARRSSNGGTKANVAKAKVKEHALALVAGRAHEFRSRNHAATTLAPEVFAFAKASNTVMFETQMVNNLNRWFKGVDFGPKT